MPGKIFAPAQTHGARRRHGASGATATRSNHTVTADGDAFDSGYLAPGDASRYIFAKPGLYAYHCTIHKFMKGVVVDVFSLVLPGGKPRPSWDDRSSSPGSRRRGRTR